MLPGAALPQERKGDEAAADDMRERPLGLHGRQRVVRSGAVSILRVDGLRRLSGARQMLWDRVRERKRRGKAGFGGNADEAGAPKMFMLPVQ